jgi:hypothetical protein
VDDRHEHHTSTPFLKRLPVVLALGVSLAVAEMVTHTVWIKVVVLIGMLALSFVVLRFVFRLPLERILVYKEFK